MRGRQIRTFLVILSLTTLVWAAVVMSEDKEYLFAVRVEMEGFDAKRFAVVEADSSVTLFVESSGFNAMLMSLRRDPTVLNVNMKGESVRDYTRRNDSGVEQHRSVAVADLSAEVAKMLSVHGLRHIGSAKDSLSLVLCERGVRVFRPSLEKLKINFSDGYGLYGDPKVVPSTVTLYGPEEVLASIAAVGVAPMELDNVSETGIHRVPLDCQWKTLGDVQASVEAIAVQIPVRRQVERKFTVPVKVVGADTSMHLRLYPERVTLSVWVAQDDLAAVTADRFSVSVDMADIRMGLPKLKVDIDRFPTNVRVRSLVPEEIEYVVIQ
ncbi:MAG: hypothetical protein IJ745_02955 [Bacteroidales bacterium]|nr:hypothetical protein [Bacteroidales bacterium]